jgi:predicted  nucleic acid-binding Zn-ribbon protein
MTDEIAALVMLKDVDVRLMGLTREIELVPEQIAELTRKVELLREEYGKKRTRLEELKVKRRAREKEVEEFSERIRKFEFQQFEVKTNKEYQALLHEIALLKEKRSQVEGEIIELMEQEESSAQDLKEFEGKISKEETASAEERRSLEERLEEARGEMNIVSEEKTTLVSRLSGPVRARYERVSEGKGGLAVAAVKNRACGACFTNLPPQRVNEIRKGLQLIACETCGRILVWGNESTQ